MSATQNSRYLPDSEGFRYENFPFYWLVHTAAIYEREIEKILKKLGTDIPTRRVLMMLNRHGTISVSELASHTVMKPSTATRVVQRMRDEGLVETCTNGDDARITDVTITAAGSALLERILQGTRKIYVKGYEGLSDEQLEELMRTLSQMFHNLADA